MTTRLLVLALLSLFLPPVVAFGQDGRNIVVLEAAPEQSVYQLTTRLRHTTVITLPAHENILDYIVGDAEYWHLTGSANVAFLKPTAEAAATNIALVCASGRIYSFLVRESAQDDPHLVVRVNPADPTGGGREEQGADLGGAHAPAFVGRDRVRGYELMAEQAQLQIAEVRAEALADLDAFRADYPGRIRHYQLPRGARDWPWGIEAMWHDGQFTFVRSSGQETPALYEEQDGEPSLVPYDLANDGLFVVRRVIGDGWFLLGDDRLVWRFTPPETD